MNILQSCDSRYLGVACALKTSKKTVCRISTVTNLKIKSNYFVPSPIWSSSVTVDWSSSFCSNIYCKLGTAVSGCKDTIPNSVQCAAAIPSCIACEYDSYDILSICTVCSQGTSLKLDRKCTVCSNLDSATEKCQSCSNGILSNGVCVETCPEGTMIDPESNSCIAKCLDNCAECSLISPKNYCVKCDNIDCQLECPSSKSISHFTSSTTSECISICPSSSALVPIAPSGLILPSIAYSLCLDCQSSLCNNCLLSSTLVSDITKLTVCTKCENDSNGSKLYAKDNDCTSSCGETSYISGDICIDCPAGTKILSDSTFCENCGDMCADEQCVVKDNKPFCMKCMNNSYIQEGKCLSACSGDYKVFIQTLQTGIMQCLKSCPSETPLNYNEECVKSCPSAFYVQESTQKCKKCKNSFTGCDDCATIIDSNGVNATKCRKCNPSTPYFNSDFTSCVSSCNSNEAIITENGFGYCLKCPSECSSCSSVNGKFYDLLELMEMFSMKRCPLSKYIYNGICVKTCPTGYSAQLDKGKCVVCPIDGCVECIGLLNYYSYNKCASDKVKSGNLLTGYKCTTACDKTNSNYCMKDSQCIKVTGYKDKGGNCQDCSDNCDKCSLDSAGVVQCLHCKDKFCMNTKTNSCLLAVNSDSVVMSTTNAATNMEDIKCQASCDSGYIPDMFHNCIKCNPSEYKQCSDSNCISWGALFKIAFCVKCKDGYQPNILNSNICKEINSCVGNQIRYNGKCTSCNDAISKCSTCTSDGSSVTCGGCEIGYTLLDNKCKLSACSKSILSSDGLSCVSQCQTGQYVSPTLNKCTDCTISNCKNCFLNKGTEVCYECGKDPSSANTNLSTDLLSCKSSCISPQVADSKKRCVSPPSNAATFSIAKEQDWRILDQLKKGIDVTCPHILSANTCNSGYNLLVNSDGNQYCTVCTPNTFYDSSAKLCKSCGDNCSECQSLTECKTCTPGTYPVSSKCYWNCPRGMYVSGGTCTKCDDACGGLNGSCFDAGPNSCDGCQFDTSTNKFVTYLVESVNQCVSAINCPLSTYPADNGKCMPCDSGCTSCTGLGSQNCLDTKITSVSSTICTLDHCSKCSDLTHCGQCESAYHLNSDGTCSKVCDQGYYSDDNINCKQCDDTCSTCTKAGECTQCRQKTTGGNYFAVFLISGQCQYQQCPSNCRYCKYNSDSSSPTCACCQSGFKLNDSNQCDADSSAVGPTSCNHGERLVDSCCVPCQNSFTKRCYTASRASGVIEVSIACQKGYYLSNEVCVPICKDGYFADQILGWCVKCGCNCNTCTNYVDKCNDKCSVGTFSSTNDRCEYPLSSSPVVTADASSNSFSIKFPANVAVLNRIDTDITTESIYNSDNVCGDDAFDFDWTSFLASSLNVDFIVSDLKSKLNSNEQNELDYLLSIDYSATSKSLIDNNLLSYYYMQNEKQLDIVKLIALYRWSLFGKTDLAVTFTYSDNNFYHDSSAIYDVCSLIFSADALSNLNSPKCSFVTNSDSNLTFTLTVDDISTINPSVNFKFDDVLYYVSGSTKLPVPSVTFNVPTPNVQKGMTIVIDMKETVTKCEDLTISYQNSQGLGYDTKVSIQLDSIRDTTTGDLVTKNLSTNQKTINDLLTKLLIKSKTQKSMIIKVKRIYLVDFAGQTIYFSILFKNQVTGEVQTIPKKVSIVNDAKLETVDQALMISRTKKTVVNTVKYVSCNPLLDSIKSHLTCKGTIYEQSSTSLTYTTADIIFEKCVIDPTKINVDNIARIWVEATIDGVLKTVDVSYKIDKIQCSCDLSQIKAAYGTSDSLSINSIKCPASYSLKWTFKKQSGSGSDVSFNSNSASFKILDKLASGTTYMMSIDVTNSNMNVVYGTCTHLVNVQSQFTTLDTQIRDGNSGSLQGALELDIITFENNKQIFVDSATLTLTESGSSTDLLKTTFSKSYKFVDNSKLTFSPGVWNKGTTYILTAATSLKGVTGKATKLITVADNSLFNVDFSPKIASTRDTIKVTITNKSSTQCLFCAVGFYYNNIFDPFEVISDPDLICESGTYRDASITVPVISDNLIKNTDLAVLCIGDDTDISAQERTNLWRSKISITSKTPSSSDISTDYELASTQDFDRACLSILALPYEQCPDSSIESICQQAIANKGDLLDINSGKIKKILKDLTNKLIYSLTKAVTCGNAPFENSKHDIVQTILNGICKTFAADDSTCKAPDSNAESISCISFDSEFINKILTIVNNIEARIITNDYFSDLYTLLDYVQSLIECASTDTINSGSGTEVHAKDSSISILKVKKLSLSFKTLVKHSKTTRRNLAAAQSSCGMAFNKIPSSLSNQENLIIKVQYTDKCNQYTSKTCNGSLDLLETPPCCEIIIQNSVKDSTGATTVSTINVQSSDNGVSSLTVPTTTCSANTKCAYYDSSKGCWSYDGVSTSDNCSGCLSTHLSIFSFINPSSKANSSEHSDSSSSNKNPATAVVSVVTDNLMMIYENILIYVCALLNIYLFLLFIKTCRNKHMKVQDISKNANKINVKGYTKTLPVPKNEDVEEKIGSIRDMFQLQFSRKDSIVRVEESKAMSLQRNDKENDAEQSYDAMENDNIVEAQTIVLEKSYCSSYFSTFWRKHRIVSPLIFIHPTLSSFSRGINVAFSVLTASFLITIGIFGMASEYVTTATIITGLILSRIVCVLLEMILHNKRQKYINIIQSIIITILLVLEGVVVFIPTKIHNQHTSLVSISIILFLLLEFILYELLIHAIHVFISRKLIKSPSNIDKMSSWTKHFLNPMVYDHINQFD